MLRTTHDLDDFHITGNFVKPRLVKRRPSRPRLQCTISAKCIEARLLIQCRRRRQLELVFPRSCMTATKNIRPVPASSPIPYLVQYSHGPTNQKQIKHSLDDIYHHSGRPRTSPSSSGSSSPQSSYNSLIFSPAASSAGRSPPSSESSISELSPQPIQFIRRQPRIQVSSLLADSHTRTYHLEVVQHPLRTAEFGLSNLSRLPLTPPIIAQLIVRDPSGNSVVPEAELPFLIAHLSLFSEDGMTPLDMGSSIGRGHTPPILYGNLVSSIEQLEDLQGNTGLFFLFPDVSIRWRGRYQIGITLSRISGPDGPGSLNLATHGTILAEARTRPFDVLALNQYTAVPPTRLTQCFLRQGARMFTFMSYST